MVHAGIKLYEQRTKKGYTLEEVSKATKIRVSFLECIEKGEYKKLPSGTYAHGFVKNYAKFLGLPENELLALFKREYDEEKFLKVLPEGLLRPAHFHRQGSFQRVPCIFADPQKGYPRPG